MHCGEEVCTFVKKLISITSNNILPILDKSMQEAKMKFFWQNFDCGLLDILICLLIMALLICLLIMVGVFVAWANQDQKREL